MVQFRDTRTLSKLEGEMNIPNSLIQKYLSRYILLSTIVEDHISIEALANSNLNIVGLVEKEDVRNILLEAVNNVGQEIDIVKETLAEISREICNSNLKDIRDNYFIRTRNNSKIFASLNEGDAKRLYKHNILLMGGDNTKSLAENLKNLET